MKLTQKFKEIIEKNVWGLVCACAKVGERVSKTCWVSSILTAPAESLRNRSLTKEDLCMG